MPVLTASQPALHHPSPASASACFGFGFGFCFGFGLCLFFCFCLCRSQSIPLVASSSLAARASASIIARLPFASSPPAILRSCPTAARSVAASRLDSRPHGSAPCVACSCSPEGTSCSVVSFPDAARDHPCGARGLPTHVSLPARLPAQRWPQSLPLSALAVMAAMAHCSPPHRLSCFLSSALG